MATDEFVNMKKNKIKKMYSSDDEDEQGRQRREERMQAELQKIRKLEHPKIQQLSPRKVGLQMCSESGETGSL